MFDVGFWELCLVGLVSLLVIGPERLPKAARIAGFWIGKTRNIVATVKAEIRDELQAEELRQTLLQQQKGIDDFQQMLEESQQSVYLDSSTEENPAEKNSHNDGE